MQQQGNRFSNLRHGEPPVPVPAPSSFLSEPTAQVQVASRPRRRASGRSTQPPKNRSPPAFAAVRRQRLPRPIKRLSPIPRRDKRQSSPRQLGTASQRDAQADDADDGFCEVHVNTMDGSGRSYVVGCVLTASSRSRTCPVPGILRVPTQRLPGIQIEC